MPVVAITQNLQDIGVAIREALDHIPLETIVKGRKAAIKPNETWATAEDTSAVTQGDTLRAVIREVKRHQPASLVVTGGSGAAETDEVFRHSGMLDVVRAENVDLFDYNRPPFVEVPLEYAPARDVEGPQHAVMVNPRVLEYEALIVGLVIASTDAVAADCVGARLLGFTAQAVRHLWEAGKLGLGETDLDKIEFPAMSFDDAAKAFTQAAYGRAITLQGA